MWSRFVMSQVKHNSYFLCGVVLGLWVSLVAIPLDEEAPCAAAAALGRGVSVAPDEFEPRREERPLGPAPPPAASRSVQRPRYYSTELGMRGSLLAGVLSSEAALHTQVSALNRTMARLQPALKFFITASAVSAVPGLANVVGFTDTREMLKPFHALKYLADNYLEEYDFFFLVSDATFVNARRLAALAAALSVSQDLYMGTLAEDDSHYCSLEGGILLSNSVLRAVHAELDWCVRNSYSPHHHENIGRCVLHAAHLSCSHTHQGQSYSSVRLRRAASEAAGPALHAALADAVAAHPASPDDMHLLHAYIARVHLERARTEALRLRVDMWRLAGKHPPHARNATWPAGLRADPGLAPPAPDTRFDHLRWTLFNATHAFMPDEHRAVGLMTAATKAAVDLVVGEVVAWARARWAWAVGVELAEGAWQWDPPRGLRYRLLLRLRGAGAGGTVLRAVEAARALGAARLVPVRYVTESARVVVVVPLPVSTGAVVAAAAHALRHRHLANTDLVFVTFRSSEVNETSASVMLSPLRDALAAHPAASVLSAGEPPAPSPPPGEVEWYVRAGRGAVRASGAGGDALILLAPPHLEYNQDFLNRVRMNTLRGASWFLPLPFARHAVTAHPRRRAMRTRTGRFNAHAHTALAFYRDDLDKAEASWRGAPTAGAAAMLAASDALRAHVAPDPAALLPPRPAPLHTHTPAHARTLDLGTRSALAQLLLEIQHDNE